MTTDSAQQPDVNPGPPRPVRHGPDVDQSAFRIRPSPWLLAGLFAAAALALAVGGHEYRSREARAIRHDRYAELHAIAELKTGQVAAWRKERLADARVDATGIIRADFLRWLRAPTDEALKTGLLADLKFRADANGYRNLILTAPDGRLLLSLDAGLLDLDDAKPWVAKAVATREAAFGDFVRSPTDGSIHLDVAAPILDDARQPAGVLLLRTDPADSLYPLIQAWPMPSKSAETLLLRRDGEQVLFLNTLRHNPAAPLTLRLSTSAVDVPAVQAAMGRTGLFEGCDYRGIPVLSDVRPVPDSPWFMVAKVDSHEILAEARYRGGMILLLVAIGIVMSGVLTVFVYSRRQRDLYRKLYRAEREQRNAQEEIRATFYGIGDGVIATDAEGRVTRMNPVAEQLTGWSEAEAMGQPLTAVFRIINEQTRAEVENPVGHVLRDGMVVGLANHTVLIARDGTERPIADSAAPIRVDQKGIAGVVLVFRDQTVEHANKHDLQASETRYRRLFESTKDGILILDANTGLIMDVNPFLIALLGYTHAEFVGKHLWDIDLFKDIAASQESFLELQAKDYVRYEGLPLETRDGRGINVEFVSNVYPVNSTRVIQCNIRDISERQNARQQEQAAALEVRRLLAEAEQSRQALLSMMEDQKRAVDERQRLQAQLQQAQKLESIGTLAGGVAHEINNPLMGIMGYAQLISDSLATDNPATEYATEISKEAERVATIVKNLLAFARDEKPEYSPARLHDIVGDTLSLIRTVMRHDQIALEVDVPADLLEIRCRSQQIRQVIMNLLTNARDALNQKYPEPDANKKILISAKLIPNAECRMPNAGQATDPALPSSPISNPQSPTSWLRLTIEDHGSGIPEDARTRIFDPFFSTKARNKGTGLGLSISHGIVKEHGGELSMESEVGQWTRFHVDLPAETP